MTERFALGADCYCRLFWLGTGLTREDYDSLSFVYERMEYCGYLRSVFYDLPKEPSKKQFIDIISGEKFLPVVLYKADCTPIAFEWIESVGDTDRVQRVHFCTLDLGSYEDSVQATRLVMKEVGHKELGFEQYIGLTPACYRHALKFVYDCGFKPVLRLKKAVYCLGKERDAILTECDPNTL